MKTFIAWIASIVCVYHSQAQSYHQGQLEFSLGAAIKPQYIVPGTIPFVTGSYAVNYGLTKFIQLGMYYNQSSSIESIHGTYETPSGGNPIYWVESHQWRFYRCGVRGVCHFNSAIKNKRWDVYAGAISGVRFVTYHAETSNPGSSNPIYPIPHYVDESFISAIVGGQFQLTPYVGIWMEIGSSVCFLNIGVNGKIKT